MSGYTCPFQSPSIFALRLGDIYLGLRDAEDVAKSDPMLLWGGDMLFFLLLLLLLLQLDVEQMEFETGLDEFASCCAFSQVIWHDLAPQGRWVTS